MDETRFWGFAMLPYYGQSVLRSEQDQTNFNSPKGCCQGTHWSEQESKHSMGILQKVFLCIDYALSALSAWFMIMILYTVHGL